jgi:hypothetical protein
MKKILSNRYFRVSAILLCGLGVVRLIRASSTAFPSFMSTYSLVGMVPTQTLRLNVSNLASPFPTTNACQATLTLTGSNGATQSTTVTLPVGQSFSYDLAGTPPPQVPSAPSRNGAITQRIEVQPGVTWSNCQIVSSSVEVFDTASGLTNVYAGASNPGNHNETMLRDPDAE